MLAQTTFFCLQVEQAAAGLRCRDRMPTTGEAGADSGGPPTHSSDASSESIVAGPANPRRAEDAGTSWDFVVSDRTVPLYCGLPRMRQVTICPAPKAPSISMIECAKLR